MSTYGKIAVGTALGPLRRRPGELSARELKEAGVSVVDLAAAAT